MIFRIATVIFATVILVACDNGTAGGGNTNSGPRATRISVTRALADTVEVTDTTIGRIDSKNTPMVMAEVNGNLKQVLVDTGDKVAVGDLLAVVDDEAYQIAVRSGRADVKRLEALVETQQRLVVRNESIYKDNFITETVLEESQGQLRSLREQLNGARARLQDLVRDLRLTEIRSPLSGSIDQRFVSMGEYVKDGQALFRLVSQNKLTIYLPFPETMASQLKSGLTVKLSSPLTPDRKVTGVIRELRPALNSGSRTVEAIIDIKNPGDWRTGASILGTVVLDKRQGVTVPEISVVERPNGKVVYVIKDDQAHMRKVTTGVKGSGRIEILSGLQAGEQIAVKGAAYLTDNAVVSVQEEGA